MATVGKVNYVEKDNVSKYCTISAANIDKVDTILWIPSAGGDRGLIAGGEESGGRVNTIDYITISTTGNATNFGDLRQTKVFVSATSNGGNDRAVFGGGIAATTEYNNIDYRTISTTGNCSDFGDLTIARFGVSATSNGTLDRGVFGGGAWNSSYTDRIEYITISSIGNAIDFGDLVRVKRWTASCSNFTNDRGIWAGGTTTGETELREIDYITISTTGDASDFGDLVHTGAGAGGRDRFAGCSSGERQRGVFGGGENGDVYNLIDYITISTTGNASNFGDLTVSRSELGSTSNGVNERGCWAGGDTLGGSSSAESRVIDYITISTPGDATNFGDLTADREGVAGTSNA